MMNATIHIAAQLLSLAAFSLLALAMERHQQALFARTLSSHATLALRVCGWLLLLPALDVLVSALDWGIGLVAFSGHTSLAAGLVCLALIVHERIRA